VWTIVAFALVASTLLKGVLDYGGTYLANYAGFSMVTDLRNELYTATLRRSIGFFQKHSTGSCCRRSSTTWSACSSRCPACWPNFCSSFLPSSSPRS
jgi:ABC-type multidrug transport system fused ATPase/permease subunit